MSRDLGWDQDLGLDRDLNPGRVTWPDHDRLDAVAAVCPPDVGSRVIPPPPDPGDEHEEALRRAEQLVDQARTALHPVLIALAEGAWVSSAADVFSLELNDAVRRTVQSGEAALEELRAASVKRPPRMIAFDGDWTHDTEGGLA